MPSSIIANKAEYFPQQFFCSFLKFFISTCVYAGVDTAVTVGEDDGEFIENGMVVLIIAQVIPAIYIVMIRLKNKI